MITTTDMYVDGRYLAHNPTWGIEDSHTKAGYILDLLQRHKLNFNQICEVGCGAGEILRQLSFKLPATHFTGYEISPIAYELCKTRANERISFHCADLIKEDIHFDCVLCMDVFEHVSDYLGFIEALRAKADYKIFHIPLDISVLSVLRDRMMDQRHKVGHLHYFTTRTALASLQDCGYEIVDYYYTTWFDDMPRTTLEDKVAVFLRKRLYSISPDLMAKWMGGCSLLVLAK